ncbi:protein of unknown function (plasmid) [Shinella sp. WSC3-e]|nr:hypothetical protein SHINE37_100052 [Rhizobiaceae bacterium]CAK7261592.1 protein of unknown function [Shinella sp. WSC3-e]
MATIGTFTSTENGFTGSIRTLALNVKARIARVENPSDKGPQFASTPGASIMQRAGFCGVLVAEACFCRCLRWILLRIIPEPSVPLR